MVLYRPFTTNEVRTFEEPMVSLSVPVLKRGAAALSRVVMRGERGVGTLLGVELPMPALHALAVRLSSRDPNALLQALGPTLNRERSLETMPFDLPISGRLEFEHLSGLFASTSLDHGVIAMTVRQTAYLFGLVRQMAAKRVIEIGRYRGVYPNDCGGDGGRGRFWSIDIGEKEVRMYGGGARSFDAHIRDACRRFGLNAELIMGDSRSVDVETGDVDLVFIDGDHSYEGVRNDFERFGRRVRAGGAILFDDAFDERHFATHSDTVGRLVREIVSGSEFRLVTAVDRLAQVDRAQNGS
ncbi:MAG: class I SAM-dependent methyltransferase [Chloroflexota bacterium]